MGDWHPNAKRGLMAWHVRRRESSARRGYATSPSIPPLSTSATGIPRTDGSLPVRLLSALEDYGSWLTVADLMLRCPVWKSSRQRAVVVVHTGLDRLRKHELARRWTWRPVGHRKLSFWTAGPECAMSLEDAQELILRGVPFGDVFPEIPELERDQLHEWYLHEPGLPNLTARNRGTVATGDEALHVRASGFTGDVCPRCQSTHMVRSGACLRCEDCGETTGC